MQLLDPKPLDDKWGKLWIRRMELNWHGEPLWASMAIVRGTGPGWLDTVQNYQEI